HHDSWLSSPGASDNASGVAVILELARYFANQKKQYPFNIKFVTFGAEEFGLLGSKAYLMEHQKDLGKCILMFNVDNLGGESLNLEMLGKFKNIPSGGRIYNQIPLDLMEKATADLRLNWKFLNPGIELNASNVPSWLQELLKETAQDLGFEIQSLHNIGSDHQVFAQAGVVATDITSTIGNIHTPEDLPERLNSENLEHAAQIIAGVVERMR
ncbi:MAG: M28 family metallopeptidase, partial [Acidobacteriota bacterium]